MKIYISLHQLNLLDNDRSGEMEGESLLPWSRTLYHGNLFKHVFPPGGNVGMICLLEIWEDFFFRVENVHLDLHFRLFFL